MGEGVENEVNEIMEENNDNNNDSNNNVEEKKEEEEKEEKEEDKEEKQGNGDVVPSTPKKNIRKNETQQGSKKKTGTPKRPDPISPARNPSSTPPPTHKPVISKKAQNMKRSGNVFEDLYKSPLKAKVKKIIKKNY